MSELGTPVPSIVARILKRGSGGSVVSGQRNQRTELESLSRDKPSSDFVLSNSANRLLLRAPWLVRRAWVVVISTVLVALVAVLLTTGKPATYSANAVLLVSPGASATSPGSPAEAQGLAVTYSGLIPNDSAILHAVASVMDLTNVQVQHDISVNVVSGTSILVVQFTEKTPARAITGARAIASAIAGTPPVTKAIPNGTVNITSPPTTATRHATKSTLITLIGLVLGFLLGVVVMIVWEQADARFDKPGQITGSLRIPARSLRGMSEVSAASLIERWRTLSRRHPARIALVAGVPGMTGAVIELSRRLSQANNPETASNVTIDSWVTESTSPPLEMYSSDVSLQERGGPKTIEYLATVATTNGVVLLPSGTPGREGGEAIAQHADLSVLIVPRGARAREIREAFVLLRQVGVRPKWALLVDTKRDRFPRVRSSKDADQRDSGFDGSSGREDHLGLNSAEFEE